MFSELFDMIAKGCLPDEKILIKRLQAALIKKIGTMSQPYLCRTSDPKINPPAKQLLWAAILTEDSEKYQIVKDIISAEIGERNSGMSNGEISVAVEEATGKMQDELGILSSSEKIQGFIQKNIARCLRDKK